MPLTPIEMMIARGDERPRQLGFAWALERSKTTTDFG